MAPKSRLKLDQIRIASPCPTSWEDMIGDDQIRFCNICSKNVYNLSSMTRTEAELLINEKQGNLCGLLYLRKDGSIMTADCPIGLAAIRKRIFSRIARVAAIVAALVSGSAIMLENHKGIARQAGIVVATSNERNETVKESEIKEDLKALGGIEAP